MRPLDRWRELWQSLRRRRLRTALTALSVAWGIFMLVVLLAAGRGLANGAEHKLSAMATNALWFSGGKTSKPHRGQPVGKKVDLTNEDFDLIRASVPGLRAISGRLWVPAQTTSFEGRSSGFPVYGCHPDHLTFERNRITQGRFINELDIRQRRKVAVISETVVRTLFPGGRDPLGAFIEIGGVHYLVVGVMVADGAEQESETIYLPISTTQIVFKQEGRISQIAIALGEAPLAEVESLTERLRQRLAARHGFAPSDRRAVHTWNSVEIYDKVTGVLAGIRGFVWLIGLGTILAGVVGVSNIMMISVRERTREIGVRKAIGATPRSIVASILEEALFITTVSGYVGLVAAAVLVTATERFLPVTAMFRHPRVDVGVGLAATMVLVVAGTLAGLFPALAAARVQPIAALRSE